ncbi:HAD family hydrolase [Bradyrhizobium sp. ARR65]|uniref:HAD family hydrolase n=1 Tax=Bradyrhizobium sp. ARR65 TaxID=1040989 RepID=UPI000465A930|nr:HAD family hydrolase [Bradyrhizobium sp. ARR65]
MTFGFPEPDLIIFDCDGVLVDSEVLSCGCLSEVLGQCGIELSEHDALDLFLGRSTAAVLQHYDGRLVPENFLRALKAQVFQQFRRSLRSIPGVSAVISQLTVPFCVASSSDLDRVRLSLGLTDLARYFGDRLYTAQMVARGKPAPDLFLHAAAQMQADPQRTLVVEDSVSGVSAAKAAGMMVWGFVGGSHYRSRDGRSMLVDAGADRVFDQMANFWKGA